MKTLLIQPPSGNTNLKVPPLGLAYIAAVLKRNNIETKIIDLNVEQPQLQTVLANEKPELIGVSSMVTNARLAFNVAELAKKVLPESFVVMGGPYASMMKNTLIARHSEVDAVAVGEGEYTFLELAKQLEDDRNLQAVKGQIFRKGKKIKASSPQKPVTPLDTIPFPAREELKMSRYGENAGVLFTSRGCPQQCIFCSRPVFGRQWRGHSPDYVLKEIEQLVDRYGVSMLSVLDDNFTVDLKRAEQILDGIAEQFSLGIYFWNGLRADHMTENLVRKLKRAGCRAINFGIESVDPDVISFIRKGVSLEQIERAIRLARQAGIKANAFLMIGNAKDTPKTADKIIDFVKRVHVNGVHLSMATPILGTPFWDWVEKNGRWLNYDTSELLDWPVDDVAGAYPVFETPEFTAKQRTNAYMKVKFFLNETGLAL
jgi:anaerobic magnesium-protoporphyrin IX monomethyl ester cyclase